MKKIKTLTVAFASLFILVMANPTKNYAQVRVGVSINVPFWAPQYENVNAVNYYYLPDIQSFYDIRRGEFVFQENGMWIFSPQLPPQYSWYDFNNAYAVVLNAGVYEPWMHFHRYLASYPPYYYRSMHYRDGVRGYNENGRLAIYNRSNYARDDRRMEPVNRDRRVEPSRPSQRVEYKGTVGQPVRVDRSMRQQNNDRRGGNDRREGNDRDHR